MLMIEDDAREVTVNAVVEIEHIGRHPGCWVLDVPASDDVAGKSEGGGHIVAARLTNDANARWEMLVKRLAEHGSHFLKGVAGKAAAHIEGLEVVANFNGLVEHDAGVLDGFSEALRVRSSRSDVETDAYDVQVQPLSQLEKALGAVHRGSKFETQATQA